VRAVIPQEHPPGFGFAGSSPAFGASVWISLPRCWRSVLTSRTAVSRFPFPAQSFAASPCCSVLLSLVLTMCRHQGSITFQSRATLVPQFPLAIQFSGLIVLQVFVHECKISCRWKSVLFLSHRIKCSSFSIFLSCLRGGLGFR
jgi:hypothetical protein